MDVSGFVYTSGYFGEGSCDFDPGAGTFPLTSAGMTDIFISKYSQVPTDVNSVFTQKFNISPNPSNGNFIIRSLNSNGKYTVYNILGEVLMEFDSPSADDNRLADISRNQPNGIYFIKLSNDENNFIKKNGLAKITKPVRSIWWHLKRIEFFLITTN